MNERVAVHHAPYFGRGHEGANRHDAPTQSLRGSDNIGGNIPMLNTPQFAGAPHTGLHLICYQQYLVLIAHLAQARPEIIGGNNSAGLALHRLHDDSSNIIADLPRYTQLLLTPIRIAIRYVKDVIMQGHGRATENRFTCEG